ncbi:hypothetical protein ACM2U8_23605 [Escherichia coli]|nr:hypothetical protein [Escherichia coli]
MKQMSLIEMDGFLKGKCIPSDLKVNETNAEYLVRKFGEAEAKISALSEDQQRAIESIKQADAAVKLAHEKFSALAAENELARKAVQAFCDVVGDNTEVIAEVVGRDGVLVILEAMKATGNMPATDAFLAEVRAQGVEMLAKNHQSIVNALKGDSLFSDGEYRHAAVEYVDDMREKLEAAEKRIAELESGSQAQKLVEAIIVAIENEQERLFDEDYLMDSKECIDVIREEVKRWNDSRAPGIRIKGE